jgi:cellulose synthase/poly-beta-1,6-N-acetylglucosamine synthase-like glycosyltransferase
MHESLDVVCRVRWHRLVEKLEQIPGYLPMVSLQVPAYNEPVEVVEKTLNSLAGLNYPDFEVLVVDNNTPLQETWRPLEEICRKLGPNFHCLHLEQWPGYKSGALNFAVTQTDPRAEIIGIIDADYEVDPNFLRELVPAFADPQVAFVQTPQDYSDSKGDIFSESTYHGYKYFFEVSMPSRNERNAIIFAGTMGLIRKSVLEEIGGWDEWCITEDAEASLRILKRGYRSLYINHSFGSGMMPINFEGLKKQRFRWCFGGIQILKKHWEALMPWAHWVDPQNKLTLAQRYYYLVGGLGWFSEVFNLLFAFFLVLGAVFNLFSSPVKVRPLTDTVLIIPAVFRSCYPAFLGCCVTAGGFARYGRDHCTTFSAWLMPRYLYSGAGRVVFCARRRQLPPRRLGGPSRSHSGRRPSG